MDGAHSIVHGSWSRTARCELDVDAAAHAVPTEVARRSAVSPTDLRLEVRLRELTAKTISLRLIRVPVSGWNMVVFYEHMPRTLRSACVFGACLVSG